MKALVIAPHPDDEVFGVGGAIARMAAEGVDVTVAIVTKGRKPLFSDEAIANGRAEALEAHRLLGVKETIFLDSFTAAMIDTHPRVDLIQAFEKMIGELKPEVMFIPFIGDVQLDHRIVFEAAITASRPNGRDVPQRIYAYETVSETNWSAPFLTPSFSPNTYIDISDYLEIKLQAVRTFKSQVQEFPNERSVEAVRNLALRRGATVGFPSAEAFVLIRSMVKGNITNHI